MALEDSVKSTILAFTKWAAVRLDAPSIVNERIVRNMFPDDIVLNHRAFVITKSGHDTLNTLMMDVLNVKAFSSGRHGTYLAIPCMFKHCAKVLFGTSNPIDTPSLCMQHKAIIKAFPPQVKHGFAKHIGWSGTDFAVGIGNSLQERLSIAWKSAEEFTPEITFPECKC